MTKGLFETTTATRFQPLAARMRPRNLDEYVGQSAILAKGKPLRDALEQGMLHSMVFWGPPGVGKTTLARLIAHYADADFVTLSAVLAGVKDIREAVQKAQMSLHQYGRKTILFVDEVHRFNKSQQDAFLPYVEDGTILFIGATTENPSFELNNALMSRARLYVLKTLADDELATILLQALADKERGYGNTQIEYLPDHLGVLAKAAHGDARRALNLLELAIDLAQEEDGVLRLDETIINEVVTGDFRRFDKGGDIFYEQISALHKSVRGSDPDASLYWFARMLDGGCDPVYIARRVVRMASEDIGNADPRSLQLALNAWDVQERLGSPEGELAIAQAVVYLACAPKSNAVYSAYNTVLADVKSQPEYAVPLHLRNAPTSLMKDLDYGAEYRYAHDEINGFAAGEAYLPEEIAGKRYYFPVARGLEQKIDEKLKHLRQLNQTATKKRYEKEG
jgi:putative ATPase